MKTLMQWPVSCPTTLLLNTLLVMMVKTGEMHDYLTGVVKVFVLDLHES